MVSVKIPATSANLGAGFDCLGLAVDLYNYVDMELSDSISITSADSTFVPNSPSNLVYSSAEHLFNLSGKKLSGLKIVQRNNIPMTRGLGSSSACIVGGLAGANALLGSPYSIDDLVNIASKIEGHPDNTTPAILGGIVTAAIDGDKVYWTKQCVYNDLMMIAIIPDFKLSTATARGCLPDMVSHTDARFNISRAALFTASLLQGKYENIRVAVNDRLHQPYRLKLINKGDAVMAEADRIGAHGSYISGAGPTLMSIVSADNTQFVSEMRQFLDESGLTGWEIMQLSIDNTGVQVV